MKNELLEKVLNAHKNLIVEGDIASGKTTNVLFSIVDKAIDNKESLFILDSKEEYINKYYNKLKENDYNTIIINLRDLDKSDGWNPLEYLYDLYKNGNGDKAQEYLEKIGKVMFHEDGSQDPYWALTATDFFTGIVLGLFEDGKEKEINFNSINNMFNGIDKKYGTNDYLTTYFKSKDVASKPYIFASSTILAPRDTKGSILSVARQKLRLYVSREKLSHLMNKTTFNYDDVATKPTAIIFIARDENKSLNTLTTMFIEQLYSILIDKKSIRKFNFILDNFDIVENCYDLVDILGSCLARNKRLFIATRSLDNLSSQYGSYMTKLCDLIKIQNDDIMLVIDNCEEKIAKNFEKTVINNTKINYPILDTNKIELFDLESYVIKDGSSKISTLDFPQSNMEPFKMDDLIKSIDKKIEQLDMEEKIENSKYENVDIKSELEQFKIEDE